jgi:fibronectin type 3 domain-containing protein
MSWAANFTGRLAPLCALILAVSMLDCWGCGTGTAPTQSAQHSVSLSWTPSTSPNVEYNVYRGTRQAGPYPAKLTSAAQQGTTFIDSTVQSGITYYYVVTAIDANGESAYSNETPVTVPSS